MEDFFRDIVYFIGGTIIVLTSFVSGYKAHVWLLVFFPELERFVPEGTGPLLGLIFGFAVIFWPDPPPPDQELLDWFEEFQTSSEGETSRY